MSEERVTTGSEPRRTVTLTVDEWDLLTSAVYCFVGDRCIGNEGDKYDALLQRIREGVEPGHDEQTEDPTSAKALRSEKESTCSRTRLSSSSASPCFPPSSSSGSECRPDLRTVAAVVEALRWSRRFDAARVIEERFKPSAPGGDDAGG